MRGIMDTTDRNRLTAVIHMQKKRAALTDDEYRMVLFGATGKESCADCSSDELKTVFQDMNIILTQKRLPAVFPRACGKPSLADAVIARAKKLFGPQYKQRIDGFIRKMGRQRIEDCSGSQLRRLMGFMNAIERKGNARTL